MKPIQSKRQRLWLIFVLALAISIIFGKVLPSYTQTSPVSKTCEQLKLNIQTRAKEDANADRFNFFTSTTKKKKITDISKLYDQKNSQHSCFEQYELWDIYEKEYDGHKYPAWMPVFFVLFVGGIFGVVLSDALKKVLNQSLEAIANWLYNKFAGTSFFENIALKKYRQALIDKYQKLKIPFRPNRPLEMREIFVPLKVAGKSEQSKIEARKAVRQYRRLMVKGAPGSGKSMLLKYLALSYADAVLEDATDSNLEESNLQNQGRLRSSQNRTVAILLELNRLNDENLTVEKLEQQLVEVCARNNFPNANRFIREGLKQGRLMLLLDGLDEVSSSVRPHVVRRLNDFLDTYENCCAIITCRTAVYKNEFVHVVEQTLEIVEFNDQQIRRFLQAWKSEMPIDKSVEQLMQTLRDRPKIMTLARNPLLLTIIAYLYCDTVFVLPHSRAEFYTKATNVLLELRDQEKNIPNLYTGVNKRRILQHLALYAQKSINRQQKDRRSLSYQEVLEEVKQVLPSLNLEAKEADSIVNEIVNRSGLLLRIDDGERYQFAHLSLQEYFVAAALIDKQEELIQFWQDAPSDWREIVKLWCGLANNCSALVETVYQNDQLTAFECLADAQEVKQEVAEEIIAHFKSKLGQDDDEGIISAFGAVAADFRPRGKELFQFLVEKLVNQEESVATQKVVAKALSMTNLPQAAEQLANYYQPTQPHFREVREALIRMGGLGIAMLESLARKGYVQAMDDLVAIGIPEAAEALERLLDDPKLKVNAAYRLTTLLGQLEESQSERNRIQS